MLKKIAIFFFFLTTFGCNNTAHNSAGNVSNKENTSLTSVKSVGSPLDSETIKKRINEAETPGVMQKMLASFVGNWRSENTFRMDETAASGQDIHSTENTMILGGRYLQMVEKGSNSGIPFEGIGILCYDNTRKVFICTWQDNMSTGTLYFEGGYDTSNKVITLKGFYEDPIKGKIELRQTYKMVDDKHYENEWYGTQPDAKEVKFIEKKLTKK